MSVQKEWRVDIAAIDYKETKPQLQVVIDYNRARTITLQANLVDAHLPGQVIVAISRPFEADLCFARVALYRSQPQE